jgi:putative transposase
MPRISRVVIENLPHHVTQRGNRRLRTFFRPEDYRLYLKLLRDRCKADGVEIWAYCLMLNHTHLIAVPRTRESLAKAIGDAHCQYTRHINNREKWHGHLWQGRFFSCPMDDRYLLCAARYIERNPLVAGLATCPQDYPWSSARAHLEGRDDVLVTVRPLLEKVPDWKLFLKYPNNSEDEAALLCHQTSGRPLGQQGFVRSLEIKLGRPLLPKKRGRKKAQLLLKFGGCPPF